MPRHCGGLGTPRRLSRSGCLRILAIQTRWYRRAPGGPRRSPYPAVAPPMLSGNRASFDGSRSLCGFSNQGMSELFSPVCISPVPMLGRWAQIEANIRSAGTPERAAGPRMRVERERVLALVGVVLGKQVTDRLRGGSIQISQAVRSRVTCLLGAPRRVALHSPAHRRGPSSSTSPDQHARRFQPV
jgi:hypothetical protein